MAENSYKVRKSQQGSCYRSWVKWGGWVAASHVCNYAWEMWALKNNRDEPYNPHTWMAEHPWRDGVHDGNDLGE